jgi:hypothetical protein
MTVVTAFVLVFGLATNGGPQVELNPTHTFVGATVQESEAKCMAFAKDRGEQIQKLFALWAVEVVEKYKAAGLGVSPVFSGGECVTLPSVSNYVPGKDS